MKKLLLFTLLICPFIGFSQNLLNETFPYTAGDLVGKGNWVITGTSVVSPIQVTTPNTLTYPGYLAGSGMISLVTTGQDANIPISSSVNSGSLYTSFLVNVSTAQSAGDYFFHFGITGNTSIFYTRCYVKSNGAGFNFGIGKTSGTGTTITYGTTEYSFNTTYLVVLKYQFNSVSSTDDVCSIFVNPDLTTGSENGLIATEITGNDATLFSSMNIRQGSSSNAAQLRLTSILSGTTWSNSVLPISLTSFTGKPVNESILLNWETASETNNDYFEVFKSSNGKTFTSVGTVKGSGTSKDAKIYSLVDENPAAGANYYQLVQHDFDGKSSKSEIISVNAAIANSTLSVYAAASAVNVSINSANQTDGTLQFFDLAGKKLNETRLTLNKGFNTTTVPLSLNSGIYVVSFVSESEVINSKFIKD